jgi:transposase
MATKRTDRLVPHDTKQREETPEQKNAFEIYFMMGDDRSYRKLAKQLGKGVTTISNWARAFDWQDKIDSRDAQVDQIVEQRNNKTMAEIKLEQARQIDAVMTTFWERVVKGKIELESWSDYERLWKIRQDIGGDTEKKRSSALADLTKMIADVGKQIMADPDDGDQE